MGLLARKIGLALLFHFAGLIFMASISGPIPAKLGAQPPQTLNNSTNVLSALKKACGVRDSEYFRHYFALQGMLSPLNPSGPRTANLILTSLEEIVTDKEAATFIRGIAKVHSANETASFSLDWTKAFHQGSLTGKAPKVVYGRIYAEDGKLEPDLILSQMPITPKGYFITEIGDTTRPLSFRAFGYVPLDVAITPDSGNLGNLVIKAYPPGTPYIPLKGRVGTETSVDPSKTQIRATLHLDAPPPNTTGGGYSPRFRWPKTTDLLISRDGTLSGAPVPPGNYSLLLNANDHEQAFHRFSISNEVSGDLGTITLPATTLANRIGKPVPNSPKLGWEKNYETAKKRSAKEKKPMLIMMTATWCGPCKMLENQTLSDPWIRHFLSGYIVVKEYENKAVEKTFGSNGYPTIVFTDHQGKIVHKTVGFQPAQAFASQIFQAEKALGRPIHPELANAVKTKTN